VALCLAVAFAGLARFICNSARPLPVGRKVLVYIGAVAILIVCAILMTRSSEPAPHRSSRPWIVGVAIAVACFGVLTTQS